MLQIPETNDSVNGGEKTECLASEGDSGAGWAIRRTEGLSRGQGKHWPEELPAEGWGGADPLPLLTCVGET